MKDLAYQRKAVGQLTDSVIDLLDEGRTRRKVVFEAPTGSGKTVVACRALAAIADTLRSEGSHRYADVAYIWFAPRKLHLQSYQKLKDVYADGRELVPVMFDDINTDGSIQAGEILFVNWESINKENNRIVRDSESKASLYEVCRRTRECNRLPIVAIIDEEHMFWSKTADRSAAVLDRINPEVEIRISATPKTESPDEKVRISRDKVIAAEMIKRQVVLNPDLAGAVADTRSLNEHLMQLALDRRDRLAEAYRALEVAINPLLLIQLPNDQTETMSTEDSTVAESVKEYLASRGITIDNGRLAVWLSEEKHNLTDLERHDNMTQVLLFKEAIALGWDCPRAAVLLIFRKLSGDEFTIQTVGRILRMPEQHYYPDESLNIGYVYTDIAKDKIRIVTADASYLKKDMMVATRRSGLNNICLNSVYADRPNDSRNYFGPDFRRILFEECAQTWGVTPSGNAPVNTAELAAVRNGADLPEAAQQDSSDRIAGNRSCVGSFLRLDVPNVRIPVPKDIHFQNEVQSIDVVDRTVKFARTAGEIDRIFISEISKYVGSFESKNNPADKLAGYLLECLDDFFGIKDTEAKKAFLYHNNRPKFDRLLRSAIEHYLDYRKTRRDAAERTLKDFVWSVPEERYYEEDTHHIVPVGNHALQPFVELNAVYHPETEFVEFLEKNSAYIDWWYKNGDKGRQHFAVGYTDAAGVARPFYVDFIIRLKNGDVMLFDTKTAGSEPETAHLKHNALIDYIARNPVVKNPCGRDTRLLCGGVIVKDGMNWIWSRRPIANTTDHQGWSSLDFRTV